MNVINGLFWLIAGVTQSISAKPVTLPVANIGGEELNAVLPSEKVLLLLLLANAVHIIWALIKGVIDAKAKHDDKTVEKLEELSKMVHEMKVKFDHLPNENALMEKIIHRMEFMVYKAVRDIGKDK